MKILRNLALAVLLTAAAMMGTTQPVAADGYYCHDVAYWCVEMDGGEFVLTSSNYCAQNVILETWYCDVWGQYYDHGDCGWWGSYCSCPPEVPSCEL